VKDAKKFAKKHKDFRRYFGYLKNLLANYKDDGGRFPGVAPAKKHRISENDKYVLYKIEMVISGLRPNQYPRVFIAARDDVPRIAFLKLVSHIDNYDNNSVVSECVRIVENCDEF
jgi:hypothetical protein